jgi:hypothetical protein
MPRPQIMLKNETLLVSLGEEGIAAHNAHNGERLWKTSLQGRFLACIGGHLWCYDIMNRITAIRLIDGEQDAWLCPGPFTIPVTNRSSERIILASPRGLLASLRPRVVASEQSSNQPSTSSSTTSNKETFPESPQPSAETAKKTEEEKPAPRGKDEPFNFFGN